jgi:threonine dehydratase
VDYGRDTTPVSVSDIFAARRRIAPHVLRTPVRRCEWLSRETGGDVWIKLESLQPTNSFKIRGAFNAALQHLAGDRVATGGNRKAPPDAGRIPIVTASAGNHGRALAYAGARLGFTPIVYAPETAPRAKLEAIRALGAHLRLTRDYDEAERVAKAEAASGTGVWLSPFSHPDVIAGAGTIGVEIIEDLPHLDAVVVPVGGGGLIGGIGIVTKAVAPRVEVVGVEVEASHPFTLGLAAGRIVPVTVGQSLADGLVGNLDPDTITFDLARRVVDRFVLASEADLLAALRGLVAHEHLIAEGAGVVPIAAVLARKVDLRDRTAVLILSGANIDAEKLREVMG